MKPETLIQVDLLAERMADYSNAKLLKVIEGYESGQFCEEQAMAACRVVVFRQACGKWFKSFEEAEAARASFAMEVAA